MSTDAGSSRSILVTRGAGGLILVAVLLAVLSGCKGVPPVIKIGLVGPFEGRYRDIGYDVIYSSRLAIREENESLAARDYRVALVALDDFGDPETAGEAAESLVLDPAVVAVVGHWLTQTTAVAAPIYAAAGVPYIPAGTDPFGPANPSALPDSFRRAYEGVSPFDEIAGPYAGAGYDAVNLILEAISIADESDIDIDRVSVGDILNILEHAGITGPVHVPR